MRERENDLFDFSKKKDRKKYDKEYNDEYKQKIENVASEEAFQLKELVESGEAKDLDEAEIKLAEKILEEREKTKDWIKKDFCDPKKIPDFLLEKYDPGEILYLLKEENKEYLSELIDGDKEIHQILNSIDYAKEGRELEIPPHGYMGSSKINRTFLEVSEEQKEKTRKMIDELRSQDQRMATFLLALSEKFHGKFGCGGGFGSFKNPSTCGGCIDGSVNLKAIFGDKIPYLEYKGDRSYRIEPFDNYKNPGYSETTPQGKIYHNTASDIEILAIYGKEKGEQLLDNINKIKDEIEKIKMEKKLYEDVVVLLGDDFKTVKEQMPEAIEFLKEAGASSLKLEAVDVPNKTLVLKGSRSEYGSSGGIGYFSNIIVWSNGQSKEAEYQWRDRFSASNDKPQYHFENLKIKGTKREGSNLNLEIEAIPDKKYRPTIVNFSFEVAEVEDQLKTLSQEEQIKFKNYFEKEIENIVAEKMAMWENKPEMVATYPDGMTMPMGTPAYIKYDRPSVTNKALSQKNGIGAFVIKEQIDHRTSDPQYRYELYITGHNKETKMAYEDHSYLKREGDSSITGLRIQKGKVMFSTREGKKEI